MSFIGELNPFSTIFFKVLACSELTSQSRSINCLAPSLVPTALLSLPLSEEVVFLNFAFLMLLLVWSRVSLLKPTTQVSMWVNYLTCQSTSTPHSVKRFHVLFLLIIGSPSRLVFYLVAHHDIVLLIRLFSFVE
jgi:hypothetical protein